MSHLRFAASATTAGTLAIVALTGVAEAKIPGSTYCFHSVCHRVLTIDETRAAIGKPRTIVASFYDDPSRDRFNPSLLTSSGEVFRPFATDNAASPVYPNGTLVAVFAPGSRRGAIVRINNSGPYWGNRMIDLSRGLAERLGINGVGRVVVEVLVEPTPQEARYRRGRTYPPVAGFIGRVDGTEAVRAHWAGSAGGTMLAQTRKPAPATAITTAALPKSDDRFEVPFAEVPSVATPMIERHFAAAAPVASGAPAMVALKVPDAELRAPQTFTATQAPVPNAPTARALDRAVREIKGAISADLPPARSSARRLEVD